MYKHTDLNDYDTQVRSERYNFRSNLDVDFSKRLKMELNLGGIIQDNNFPVRRQELSSKLYNKLLPGGILCLSRMVHRRNCR